ncbi:DUF2207 domain-containing protein [Nocardioides sp.]|uniref:DUF2207 domain-containing protein n=1 Tax=Nocardioides sp. TaxID=35761 RepID=UPI003D0F57B5
MFAKGGSARTVAAVALVALFLLGVVLVLPLVQYLAGTGESTGPDPVSVSDYSADLQVDADGTLTARETLTTTFPYGRHGIFRFWDLTDPNDSHVRLVPRDIEVTLDGADVPVDLLWENGTRYRVAKIGDPDDFVLPGTHTYVISYRIEGVLSPTSVGGGNQTASWAGDNDQASTFYWNVVAGGWQMDIAQSTVVVHLPARSGQGVQCATGYGATDGCQVDGAGTETVTVRTGPLPPRTPVTLRADVRTPLPDRVTVPWSPAFDGVLGRWWWLTAALLALGVIGFLVGVAMTMRSREPRPGFPVMYAPPEGLGPVQTAFMLSESVPAESLTATLLYQAERGLTRLDDLGNGAWTITGVALPDAWQQTDPVTLAVGEKLGLATQGTFHADKSVAAGKALNTAKSAIAKDAKAWAISTGLLVTAGRETFGKALVGLALVLGGLLAFWHPFHLSFLAVPFLLFALGGAGLLSAGVGTRRTASGREAWARAGGFRRVLSTSSAEDRFDFSAHRDLYTAYIPYAVAFDCADAWARKYQAWTGEPAPTPTWYPVYVGGGGGWFGGGSGFDSFESSLRSSISAYQATQSSSSSGGGGFSGGGGGGGGGGGSW